MCMVRGIVLVLVRTRIVTVLGVRFHVSCQTVTASLFTTDYLFLYWKTAALTGELLT